MSDDLRNMAIKVFEDAIHTQSLAICADIEATHGVKLDFIAVCGEGGIYHAFGQITDEGGMGGALEAVIDDWDDPIFNHRLGAGKARPS